MILRVEQTHLQIPERGVKGNAGKVLCRAGIGQDELIVVEIRGIVDGEILNGAAVSVEQTCLRDAVVGLLGVDGVNIHNIPHTLLLCAVSNEDIL